MTMTKTFFKYISYDERKDDTMFPRGVVKKEAHLTMVGDKGQYIDHGAFEEGEKKTGENICKKVHEVLELTNSLRSLLFVASDGTAANSGVKSTFIIEFVLHYSIDIF